MGVRLQWSHGVFQLPANADPGEVRLYFAESFPSQLLANFDDGSAASPSRDLKSALDGRRF
jgi:hypothetical protein